MWPLELPEDLRGIGMGSGAGGNRLTDVARNIPNIQSNNVQRLVNLISALLELSNVVPAQLAAA